MSGAVTAWMALVVAAAMLCAPVAVARQSVRLVVPFPPRGGTDTIARLLAPHLAEGLGRAVVIENRPGAYGTIGASHVARREPDGSRLLLSNAAPAADALDGTARVPADSPMGHSLAHPLSLGRFASELFRGSVRIDNGGNSGLAWAARRELL